jgi:hypothetical protein
MQLQYGVLNWKYYNYNVNFTIADYNIATGQEMALDFMEAKIEGAKNDFLRDFSSKLHGSSTTNALFTDGLLDIVATSATSYAGLLDTDYAADAYLPYTSTETTPTYNTLNTMITEINSRTQENGNTGKVMGLMNKNVWSRFLTSAQNQQIFVDKQTLADVGFKNGVIVNGIEFYLDSDCPGTAGSGNNYVYIFPVDIMKLYYNFGFGSDSPFDIEAQLPGQPIKSVQSYMSFNLVCNNRRLVAVNKTIVA